jgi:hypothetical protein
MVLDSDDPWPESWKDVHTWCIWDNKTRLMILMYELKFLMYMACCRHSYSYWLNMHGKPDIVARDHMVISSDNDGHESG